MSVRDALSAPGGHADEQVAHGSERRTSEGDAPEVVAGPPDAVVALTCEHASDRFPAPHALDDDDVRLAGTHWAVDLGARALTLDLATALPAPAVLATCSRLVVDVNRDLDSPTLFRDVADGAPIRLNTGLSAADREERVRRFYEPYHAAVDAMLVACRAPLVFAVHSFTHEYEGQPRAMELGVLFDREDGLGLALTAHLAAAGFVTEANEPWSGKAGLIYSAERHARAHDRVALELEVRQDLAVDPAYRARLVPALVSFLREAGTRLAGASTRA